TRLALHQPVTFWHHGIVGSAVMLHKRHPWKESWPEVERARLLTSEGSLGRPDRLGCSAMEVTVQ
ncbi:MAG: hypothetical protein VX453_05800, partial [Acidobacteriota bacterium]|nr:hypothetical protein [Acidobacteriota bacterium]